MHRQPKDTTSGHGHRVLPTVARARRVTVAVALATLVGLMAAASVAVAAPTGASSAAPKPTVATVPFAAPTDVTLADTPPPWPLPADAEPYLAAAGLSVLRSEQLEVHYHAHLDVIADGAKVTVPAGVGFVIDHEKPTGITVLHTHDTSGIIHIESASHRPYTLGQFFTEWGVALDDARLGGLRADGTHALRAYVNGRRFDGDPATIRLRRHLEIALWYGPSDQKPTVPKSYHFPGGL